MIDNLKKSTSDHSNKFKNIELQVDDATRELGKVSCVPSQPVVPDSGSGSDLTITGFKCRSRVNGTKLQHSCATSLPSLRIWLIRSRRWKPSLRLRQKSLSRYDVAYAKALLQHSVQSFHSCDVQQL
jgi:hypothetical protein